MRCRFAAVLFLALPILFNFPFTSEARKDTLVKGYMKKGGKLVSSHKRTSPNKSRLDNYGTMGNINPTTGKVGKKDPFMPKQQKGR